MIEKLAELFDEPAPLEQPPPRSPREMRQRATVGA
jgi:hypothetical protein